MPALEDFTFWNTCSRSLYCQGTPPVETCTVKEHQQYKLVLLWNTCRSRSLFCKGTPSVEAYTVKEQLQ